MRHNPTHRSNRHVRRRDARQKDDRRMDARRKVDHRKVDHRRDGRRNQPVAPNQRVGLSPRDGPKPDRLPIEVDNKKGKGRPRDAVGLIATSNNSNRNTHWRSTTQQISASARRT
jgi:hypothetical protein